MTEDSDSGAGTGSRKRGNPPIVVPKGGKYSSQRSTLRRIRDLFSFQPSGAETEKKAAPDEDKPKRGSTRDPLERATVHMLPGRLRPVDPEVLQQEIRFLRIADGEQVFTLGWKIGNPPAHITLNHSSVKPLHARMTFREGSWWIESLHRLDPVTVNDDPVPFGDPPRRLEDGDAVCLGAVLFRFGFP